MVISPELILLACLLVVLILIVLAFIANRVVDKLVANAYEKGRTDQRNATDEAMRAWPEAFVSRIAFNAMHHGTDCQRKGLRKVASKIMRDWK